MLLIVNQMLIVLLGNKQNVVLFLVIFPSNITPPHAIPSSQDEEKESEATSISKFQPWLIKEDYLLLIF